MINSLALALCLLFSEPGTPAYFQIDVDARTPYTLLIDGEQIEANTKYKTEPLTELVCVEVEIRYVSGAEVVSRKFFMDIKPGKTAHIRISISARPAYVMC